MADPSCTAAGALRAAGAQERGGADCLIAWLLELKSEEARAELEAIKYAREPSDADDASTASDLSRPTTVR
eukprot:5856686-Prymnesium_polylepis.1